jgi:sugar-specific transcriptional regulator TrmB
MASIDLTPFGFTPTESRVYEVLLSDGPGTGYAIARNASLARANAYSALEGLVAKGAARTGDGQPKVFRAEPPGTVLARISNNQGEALDRLSRALEAFGTPASVSLIELTNPRGLLQILTNEIGRARRSVHLLAPAEAFPLLSPALRRAVSAELEMVLLATEEVRLPFVTVERIRTDLDWPGLPVIALFDGQSAVIAAREGSAVHGHWSTAPSFVASARVTLAHFRGAS